MGHTSPYGGCTDMTSRELMVLVDNLPEDSATKKALSGDPWTTLHHLIANVLDTAVFSRADYANTHGGKSDPKMIKRPGQADDAAAKVATGRAKHDQIMAQMRGDHFK